VIPHKAPINRLIAQVPRMERTEIVA